MKRKNPKAKTLGGARGRRGKPGKSGPRGRAGVRGPSGTTPPNVVDLSVRLDRIQALADELSKCHRDTLDQNDLAMRIHREIQLAKLALAPEH